MIGRGVRPIRRIAGGLARRLMGAIVSLETQDRVAALTAIGLSLFKHRCLCHRLCIPSASYRTSGDALLSQPDGRCD